MLLLECISPFVKATHHLWGKTHVINPVKNEHLHSKAGELQPYMEERPVKSVPM
jgi:hypothetical protein